MSILKKLMWEVHPTTLRMKQYLFISIILLMPGPLVAPLIGAGSSLFTEGMNAFLTSQNNRKQRQWNEKMYAQQRIDSLADWDRQNEYNSPRAQMQRLRDANLNPNLVYGNGSATEAASQPRAANVESWAPQAPQISSGGLTSSLMSYYDIKMKDAQMDNLAAQNTVSVQEALLKSAQILSTLQSTKSSAFDLDIKQSLKETSLEAARVSLEKLKGETQTTLTNAEVQAASKTSNIQKAAEEVLNMRLTGKTLAQALKNLRLDERVKAFQARLADQNINPGDPLWARMVSLLIDKYQKGSFDFKVPKWLGETEPKKNWDSLDREMNKKYPGQLNKLLRKRYKK